MMNSNLLYACSHCFKRFLYEDLTRDNHYCKRCYEKTLRQCNYCFMRFSPRDFYQNYCNTCKMRVKKYGKPTLCKFCKKKSTFGNQKCSKCLKKSKILSKCNCCRMEYEKKASEYSDTSLCWRCESTMQEPNSIEDSIEINSADSYSIHSPVPPLPPSREPFTQIEGNNKSMEDKQNDSMALKIPTKFLQDDAVNTQCDLANKINVLEKYIFKKDQELMGKEAEIIVLKSACGRIREIEEKMAILRRLDEQNKEIEKKKIQKKKTFALPSFKFFEGN